MFKKSFRVKSQSVMKGSDRKKLRLEIQKNYNNLSSSDMFIYCVNKQPVLFEIDKQKVLYPTVYLLWKYPDLVERFTTWPPVFKKLVDGADLMLPGLIVRQQMCPSTFKHIQKGQVCSVNIFGNRCPIGVGYTLLSGTDFYDSGMKGKGVHCLHLMGDELWSFGDKSTPPDVEDDPLPAELAEELAADGNSTNDADSAVKLEQGNCTDDTNDIGEDSRNVATNGTVDLISDHGDNVDDTGLTSGTGIENGDTGVCSDGASGGNNISSAIRLEECVDTADGGACGGVDSLEIADLTLDQGGSDSVMTPDQMDELILFCFLCAVKSSVKKSDLPLVTGTFYKLHIMKYCPAGKHLDIKKSSFKKLSKFLQRQEKTGIIKMKELTRGVDSVVDIDKTHELLRGLEVPDVQVEDDGSTRAEFVPPQVTEMFGVTSNLLPLFKPMGYSKGSALKSGDVRKTITEYVKVNNLQNEQIKCEVVLDPILAELLLTRAEGDQSTLKWDEISSRVLNKMSPVYEIAFPGQAPLVKKGTIEPIKIDVVQRASNKKATIVENLDVYGIDPKEFGHRVQVKVACSASVTPSQQKNKGPQVAIQGNQITSVADLLNNYYKIPKKYVKGAEKASKSKRR